MRERLRGREWQIACLALLLVTLVESGLFLTGGSSKTDGMPASPPHVPLLARATLLRSENILNDPSRTWYYSVPHFSVDGVLPFYRAQATHLGWRCFTSLASSQAQQGGKTLSGTGMYITAISGDTYIQINAGSLDYGGVVIGDRLDDGSIGLKITLESTDKAPACGG